VRYDEIVRRATGDNDWQLFSGARILEQLLDPAIANSPEWRTVNNGKPPLFVEDQRPNAFGGKAVHILEAMQALEFDNMQNVFLFDDSVRNVTGVVNALRTVRSKIVWTQEGLTKEIWETILRQHAE